MISCLPVLGERRPVGTVSWKDLAEASCGLAADLEAWEACGVRVARQALSFCLSEQIQLHTMLVISIYRSLYCSVNYDLSWFHKIQLDRHFVTLCVVNAWIRIDAFIINRPPASVPINSWIHLRPSEHQTRSYNDRTTGLTESVLQPRGKNNEKTALTMAISSLLLAGGAQASTVYDQNGT